jgi:hypothetical protein
MWCSVVGEYFIIASSFTLDLIRLLSYRYRFHARPVSKFSGGICTIHFSLDQIILRHFTLDELTIDPLVGISHLDYWPTNLKCACNEKPASPNTTSCHRFGPFIFVYVGGGSCLLHTGEPRAEYNFEYGEFLAWFLPLTWIVYLYFAPNRSRPLSRSLSSWSSFALGLLKTWLDLKINRLSAEETWAITEHRPMIRYIQWTV